MVRHWLFATGVGLLGQALANRAGVTYAKLLRKEVTDPLGMNDTSISLSESQEHRFIPGHLPNHLPAHAWDLNASPARGVYDRRRATC